jgi:hypothetical protein
LAHAATAASVAISSGYTATRAGRCSARYALASGTPSTPKRRKFGRIVLKAMNLCIQHGSSFSDLNKFPGALALAQLGMESEPLG